jgi:hypothetical protein
VLAAVLWQGATKAAGKIAAVVEKVPDLPR